MNNHQWIKAPGGHGVKAWINGVQVEDQARQQLLNAASMPFIHKYIAAMPDCHWGMGATVGSVIPTKKAIIPAAVGVDIGCGMMAVPTGFTANDLPDNLSGVRSAIEKAVPHGRTNQGGKGDRGAWGQTPYAIEGLYADSLRNRFADIIDKHKKLERFWERAPRHLGTLGTGNHFIEVCLDESDNVWVMLHSGSRGPGNAVGRYFIELAKEEMKRWFIQIPDVDLAYLPEGSKHFGDYIEALHWAQDYAKINRKVMMGHALSALGSVLRPKGPDIGHMVNRASAVNCHHNYVAKENHQGANVWLTRKGAVRAREGDMGIIPGSMGAKSFIVRGKGNAESFHSCSHGAGRAMSRAEAKRRFSVEDHIAATTGVECRKDADVIDETPAAYKDIDAVMAAQSDLVDIVHTLKQVVCVKG